MVGVAVRFAAGADQKTFAPHQLQQGHVSVSLTAVMRHFQKVDGIYARAIQLKPCLHHLCKCVPGE
ncbi:hypothetical protein D3C80_1724490 [compost metagenome]